MTSKKHRLIMYGVAIQLLAVAIVCYAAFPINAPEVPFRLMYQTNAGKVLFDHQTHSSVNGIALDCVDCHHTHGGEEFEPGNCGECHLPNATEGVYAEKCLDCHDESDYEGAEMLNHADAVHKQCTACHFEYGTGPLHNDSLSKETKEKLKTEPNEWANCSRCHVL